jgi:hypothetical protein
MDLTILDVHYLSDELIWYNDLRDVMTLDISREKSENYMELYTVAETEPGARLGVKPPSASGQR